MEINSLKEIVEALSTPLTLLIALLGQPFLNYQNFKRRKKLAQLINTNEIKDVINNFNKNFKEKFVIPNSETIYFYAMTGISTNHSTIEKYITLEKKLGENYSWKTIYSILKFIKIDKKEAYIKITKLEHIVYKFTFYFSIALFIVSFIFIAFSKYFNFYSELTNYNKILVIGISSVFLIFSSFLAYDSSSYFTALKVNKKLQSEDINNISHPTIQSHTTHKTS
ncbi:hypothetical protein [Tenacibaculum maritimum]|uniref:hypothetical protein n=1 Tax=Tenacibaculum maritimum TaxID=107401 RepID=UPI0010A3D20D|nr:hypothetical protein [Tenacibaculum maritimum]QCD62860.1 hypothetical protein B9C57_10135 [Tenacibaculum maritimum]